MRAAVPLLCLATLLAIPAVQAASLHIAFDHPSETVGPQKQVDVPFNVTNLQAQRVEVRFDIIDKPSGGGLRDWILILPDAVVIEPGETKSVVATVSTPYHDGYVKDHATWMVRATPFAPGTQQQAGEPADLQIGQGVKGWYVPGPSLPIALAALALAGIAARRRD